MFTDHRGLLRLISGSRATAMGLSMGLMGGVSALAGSVDSPGADIVIPAGPPPIRVAVDSGTTGAISPVRPMPRVLPEGSGAFRRALDLVANGNYTDAYGMARGFSDDLERRTIQWAAIYFGNGEIDYNTVLRFEADAPDFASSGLYKTRLEQALVKANPGKDTVIHLLGGAMPNTTAAQLALAAAYVDDGQVERAGRIVRSVWINNTLDRKTEDEVMRDFGSLLTRDDYWQRALMLLMNDRASATERIMPQLSPAQRSLAAARIAVSRKQADAGKLLDRVDPQYRDNPLFYFAQAQYAHDNGRLQSAVAWLNKASGPLPEAEQWWYERRTLARQLIAAGDPKTAYQAAAGYLHGPEGRLVDARFHAGWIALVYLGDAKTAISQFESMRRYATLPDSITQAEYWMARAYLAAGDRTVANKHFAAAGRYGTTYYGLLARAELGERGVEIRGLPEWRSSEAAFESRELVKAVRLLAANGHKEMAEPLVRRLAYSIRDDGELVLAARMAQDIDAHNLAILIADIAEQRGTPLDLFNFPKDGLPKNIKLAEIDRAAVYAIARQESHFNVDAVSRSGALGLMQLMPATAKETAAKVGVAYSHTRLTSDPAYNALLGSTYLAGQLDRFNGSLILAAAAYNAGGGNVSKWIATFGDPTDPKVDPVVWVEQIPFAETRKYVQRVLANYTVYRARLGDSNAVITDALRRIDG
ncbi:MAG TPA: lytic transglycosylase domain-containing protein [Devosiaceae bacterium]